MGPWQLVSTRPSFATFFRLTLVTNLVPQVTVKVEERLPEPESTPLDTSAATEVEEKNRKQVAATLCL